MVNADNADVTPLTHIDTPRLSFPVPVHGSNSLRGIVIGGLGLNYMLRSRVLLSLLTVCIATTACGLARQGGSMESHVRDITLVAKNQNFYDATLYSIGPAGTRQRLGRVLGNSDETFVFRWSSVELRIEIDLLPVGSTVTEPLPVDEGDQLELIIAPDLHRRIP